jgi:hypothetical protein
VILDTILAKVIGTQNERELKRLRPLVVAISERESSLTPLSDAGLRERSDDLRGRADKGESLDDLLPDAFALVREAGRRVLRMRHFDVQLIGGMVLHGGRIAEMKTGEGKTLVATLPAYLNGLTTLKKLTFSFTFLISIHFEDRGLDKFQALGPTLEELVVRRALIKGPGLRHFTNLRALDLTWSYVEDGNMQSLAGMTRLRRFWARDTSIGDKTLNILGSLLELEDLDIGLKHADQVRGKGKLEVARQPHFVAHARPVQHVGVREAGQPVRR